MLQELRFKIPAGGAIAQFQLQPRVHVMFTFHDKV